MPDISYSNTPTNVAQVGGAQYVTSNMTTVPEMGTYAVDTTAGNVTITVAHFGLTVTIKKVSTDTNKLIIVPQTGLLENQASYSTTSTTRPSYNVRDDGANFWFV